MGLFRRRSLRRVSARGRRGAASACPAAPAAALATALLAATSLAAEAPAASAPPATLTAIRRITTATATRLVIQFSAPVRYRLERSPARPDLGVPSRLVVDFLDAALDADASRSLALDEGPSLRVHAVQRNATTVRMILDVPGLSDFGAFSMPDPFRVVVDVRGRARPRAGGRTPEAAAQPSPIPAVPSTSPAARPGRAAPTPRVAAPQSRPRGAPAGRPARRFKVVVDAGHGGHDPGAIGVGGLEEKDAVLAIARELGRQLAAVPGIEVVLTRRSDVFLPLEERTARANAEGADLFLSVHANASLNEDTSGVETYYLNNTADRATLRLAAMENGLRTVGGRRGGDRDVALILSDLIQNYKVEESTALAHSVQRALVAELRRGGAAAKDLGVKRGPFYVLVGATMPCVLVEVAFITHRREGALLGERSYQEAIATGLLRGVLRFVENAARTGNL